MHHYSKFKTTVEGASLMIENDVEKFDEAILRHRLMAPVAQAAAAGEDEGEDNPQTQQQKQR